MSTRESTSRAMIAGEVSGLIGLMRQRQGESALFKQRTIPYCGSLLKGHCPSLHPLSGQGFLLSSALSLRNHNE